MLAKLAVPTLSALAVVAGLGMTPAAAQYGSGYGYGSGYQPYMGRHFFAPHRVCTPIYRWVKVHNRHYRGWHWIRIQIGRSCYWTYRR